MVPEPDNEVEPTLDALSQAFAEAMGRDKSPIVDADGEEPSPAKYVDAIVEEAKIDACPISPKSIFESILFVGHPENQAIEGSAVAKLLRGVDAAELEELVVELNAEYERHGLPLNIRSVNGGYSLALVDEMAGVREHFYGRIREARLSRLAVDVLAIVAYNQPLTRSRVDEILHQPCGRVLGQLVRRELLALQFVEEKPRKKQYVTTDRFLKLFALESIRDLPRDDDPQ